MKEEQPYDASPNGTSLNDTSPNDSSQNDTSPSGTLESKTVPGDSKVIAGETKNLFILRLLL